jgi:predicted aldo/keto reductase-like oxidoreductase
MMAAQEGCVMQYRYLGRTGCRVSALGFGCMRLPVIGGDEGRIDEAPAVRLLQAAIERGVNYFDTAYPYHRGASEPFVGRVLQGALRQQVILATKLPSWQVERGEDFDRFLDEQLRRLRTDRIDCYLLHSLKADWWRKLAGLGVLEFLERALRGGRIRFAGFSFHDELDVFKEIVDAYDWDFCQIQYNYMDEETQAGTQGLAYAAAQGLGVVVMEPLRGGPLAAQAPPDIRTLWETSRVKRTPAEWALRWVWDRPEVGVVLSGMNSFEQVVENCRIAGEGLPGSLLAEERELIGRVRDLYRGRIRVPCTGCGYCQPCPEGVNIPRIFALYNDGFIFGSHRWARIMYSQVSNAGQTAPSCSACGQCVEACPQGIDIIARLRECHALLTAHNGGATGAATSVPQGSEREEKGNG